MKKALFAVLALIFAATIIMGCAPEKKSPETKASGVASSETVTTTATKGM